MFELEYDKELINIKEEQINKKIKEEFNGIPKTKKLIEIEHSRLCHSYNTNLMSFTRTKEKLEKEYGFTNDDLNLMLEGKFDYLKWQEEQLDPKNIKKQIK